MEMRLNKKATELKRPLKKIRDEGNPAKVSALQMFEMMCNFIDWYSGSLTPSEYLRLKNFTEIIFKELSQSKKTYII